MSRETRFFESKRVVSKYDKEYEVKISHVQILDEEESHLELEIFKINDVPKANDFNAFAYSGIKYAPIKETLWEYKIPLSEFKLMHGRSYRQLIEYCVDEYEENVFVPTLELREWSGECGR